MAHNLEYQKRNTVPVSSNVSSRSFSVILRPCNFETAELPPSQIVNNPSRPLTTMKLSDQEALWTKTAKRVRDILIEQNETTFERLFDQPDMLTTATHLFLQCPSMQQKNLRAHVLNNLPQEIQQGIETFSFTTQNAAATDLEEVHHLIKICALYPDGLEKLAYALPQSEHTLLPWQKLDRYLCESGAKLVTYTRLQELYDILKRVQWSDYLLSTAYRESIPENWDVLHHYNGSDTLQSILKDLSSISRKNDDTFPILEFALRLASLAQDQQKEELCHTLTTWVQSRSRDLDLTQSQQATLREKAHQKRLISTTYLLLQLDRAHDNVFSVQCWLFDDQNNIIPSANIEVPDKPYSFEDMPGLLESLLRQCEDFLQDAMINLMIEFFLPLELLSHPIDHYDHKALQPLSLHHQIVVRSLERMQNRKQRYIWKKKWEYFQDCIKEGHMLRNNNSTALVYPAEHYKGLQAFTATLLGEDITCLALLFVPSHISPQTDDVLTAIIGAGIPVALWPREQTNHPITLHELLTELISRYPLSQLPAQIKEQRRKALASGEKQHHQGHHLTLLWDDPNRLPPRPRQLTPPPVSRGA